MIRVLRRKGKIEFFVFIAWSCVILYCTCIIKSNVIDNLMQIFLLFIMLLFVFLKKINFSLDKVAILFLALIFVSCIPDLFYNSIIDSIIMMLSYILPVIMYICVISYCKNNEMPKATWRIPIVFGIIISLLGITNFSLRFMGLPIGSTLKYVEKFGNYMEFSDYGLGVFASWGTLAGKTLYRIQTYFIEPSKMAMFLIIPFFLLLNAYRDTKNKKNLLGLIFISIAFILTMSRAGIVSIVGSIILERIMLRKKYIVKKRANTYDIVRLIISGAIFIIVSVCLIYFLVFLSKFFPNIEFLSSGITSLEGKANLIRNETVDQNYILAHVISYPFGSGFGSILELNKVTNLANALIFWIMIGGIPALCIIISLMWKLFIEYYIPSINSNSTLQRSLASAFVGLTIHSLSYGTWITHEYLLVIAFMTTIQRNRIKKIGKSYR